MMLRPTWDRVALLSVLMVAVGVLLWVSWTATEARVGVVDTHNLATDRRLAGLESRLVQLETNIEMLPYRFRAVSLGLTETMAVKRLWPGQTLEWRAYLTLRVAEVHRDGRVGITLAGKFPNVRFENGGTTMLIKSGTPVSLGPFIKGIPDIYQPADLYVVVLELAPKSVVLAVGPKAR